jgi:ABC-2 type transport system ATP-binding protein
MATEHAIEVRALRKVFPGDVEAVGGIDFTVAPGEVFSLLGPNGAGKSTTIGMLTSTVAPTSGRALLGGFDVVTEPIAARRISSVLFQDPVVDRPLTGRRHLDLHARLWGGAIPAGSQALDEIVTAFGLEGLIERAVGTYSGGERRRLEIARALVSDPHVLFLDEPTVGLDPRIRHELLDVIAGVRDRTGMTILLTTHYLDEAERLSDRIAIMRAGAIAAVGTPAELVAALGERIVEIRLRRDAHGALSALRRARSTGPDAFVAGSTLFAPVHGPSMTDLPAALERAGFPSLSAVTRPTTLDDVYLALTRDELPEAA